MSGIWKYIKGNWPMQKIDKSPLTEEDLKKFNDAIWQGPMTFWEPTLTQKVLVLHQTDKYYFTYFLN